MALLVALTAEPTLSASLLATLAALPILAYGSVEWRKAENLENPPELGYVNRSEHIWHTAGLWRVPELQEPQKIRNVKLLMLFVINYVLASGHTTTAWGLFKIRVIAA